MEDVKRNKLMPKELLNELKFKRDMYMKWKKKEITKEHFFKKIAKKCREKVKKANTQNACHGC